MAKQFFKNLPDTTTPLEASRLNGLLDGEEAMGNLVDDSIRSKNMWIPALGNSTVTANCNVVIDDNKYKVTTTASASGELYIGQVTSSGSSYDSTNGLLYSVKPNTTYSFSVSNSNFNQNYLTQYNSSKISLGYVFKGRNFTFTTPNDCYYITIRIGVANITASTTYETTVQLEEGDTITNYAPYQDFDKGYTVDSLGTNNTIKIIKIGRYVILDGEITANNATGSIQLPYPAKYRAGCAIVGYYPDNGNIQAYGYAVVSGSTLTYKASTAFTSAPISIIYVMK